MSDLHKLVKATSKLRPSKHSSKSFGPKTAFSHIRSYDPIQISINVDDPKTSNPSMATNPSTNQTKQTTKATPVPPRPPLPSVAIPPNTPDILTVNEKKFQPLSTQDIQLLQQVDKVPAPTYSTVTQARRPTVNYAAVAASFRSKASKTKLYIGLGVGLLAVIIIVVVVVVLVKKKKRKPPSSSKDSSSNLDEKKKKKVRFNLTSC